MRQKLIGVFRNIDDAKGALGLVKRENFNRAELTVICSEELLHLKKQGQNFEMAAENFIGDQTDSAKLIWPGLQTKDLVSVGSVRIGSTQVIPQLKTDLGLEEQDLKRIENAIQHQKVVAVIEADTEEIANIRALLASRGGFILNDEV